MRVVHFCDSEPGRIDGVSASAGLSVALLRQAGHDVVHHHPGPGRGGGPPGAMRSLAVPFRQVRVASPTARADPAGHVDVVHVHTTGPVGMAGFRLAAARRVPLVLTWHTDLLAYADHFAEIPVGAAYCALRLGLGWTLRDHLELARPGARRRSRLLRLGRAMLRRTSLVIAPSAKTAAGLGVFGDLPPVRTVPTPVRPVPGPVAARRGVPGDAPVVLSVGRVTREKNPALLLRAFAAVRAAKPGARLVVVGAGRNGRPVRALIRDLGLTGSVRLVPPVPPAQVAGYYRAADVLAFASTTDTQSLVVAEAEAAGLPVVLADPALAERPGEAVRGNCETGAIRERSSGPQRSRSAEARGAVAGGAVAGGAVAGRFTCDATPAALAAGLLRMLDDPGLRERTSRAGIEAAAGYPPERHLALLTAAYDAAIELGRGPAVAGRTGGRGVRR